MFHSSCGFVILAEYLSAISISFLLFLHILVVSPFQNAGTVEVRI